MVTEKLTNEEIELISKTVRDIDPESEARLNAAKEETETAEYVESEEMDIDENMDIPGLGMEMPNPTNEDYFKVLATYGLKENEMLPLISVMNDYRKNPEGNYYDRLPESFKDMALGFIRLSKQSNEKLGKNSAARLLLKELVSDAQLNNASDEFTKEFSNTILEMNEGYDKIFTEAFDDVFSNIDTIAKENPEQAEKILAIKKAFDESTTFSKQMDYINNISKKVIDKTVARYTNEVYYFNKKVNVTEVKVPDIGELLPIIHFHLPDIDIEYIKKFIIVMCKSCYDLDPADKPEDVAYIYRMVNTIYIQKFINTNNSATKILFERITEVINCIINK